MIGKTIGQYKITAKLGAGGMGEVFLAEDTKLQRKVALKFLPEKFSADPDFKSRFEHEARAVAALDHPNIVTVYELGEHDGRLFIAMQHISGSTLAELIDRDALSVRKALDLATQICEGLSAAHSAGIVHRDIKPANILVDESGRARILDFGLAKSRKATTETKIGSTLGTLQYESPEQSRGEQVDRRSDLFSFGVVFYEMITGKLPFVGDYDEAIRYAISHEAAEPLARYKSDVPSELEQVIAKLLEKEPEMRYQSADGVLPDLKRIVRELTQTTPAVSRITPATAVSEQPPKSSGSRFIFPASIVTLLIIAALVFKPWTFDISPTQEAQAAQDALAVMYFDNLKEPSDTARLGEIAANLVITNLSDVKQIKVLSSQRLYDILKRFGKEGAHVIERGTATQVAREANAKWMLIGTILRIEPRMIITSQVIDVASGQALSSQRVNGEVGEDIFAIVDKLTLEIQKDMALPVSLNGSADFAAKGTTSQEAYRYYLEGIEFENKYYRPEARESFLKAIALDSTFAMAYFYLAKGFLDQERQPEHVRKAVKYSDHATELQKTYIFAMADALAGDVSSAIAALEKSVIEHPDDKNLYDMLGGLYQYATHHGIVSAIKNWGKVIELDPLDATAYNQLAYGYKDLREYDRALEYIDQYVNLVPDEPNPYDSRGEMLLALGKFDEAIVAYRKALEIEPGFENALNALARVYCYLGDYETADSCARALADDAVPNVRAQGRFLLPYILYAQGKFAQGWKLADEATSADRTDRVTHFIYPVTHIVKAFTLHFMGSKEEAIKASEEASLLMRRLMPADPAGFEQFQAMIYMETGEPERAESILRSLEAPIEKAGALDLKAFQKLMWGKLALVRKNYDSAIALMIEAAGIDRRALGPWCEFELAKAYIQAGQPDKAIPLLERWNTTIESLIRRNAIRKALGHYYIGLAYEADGQKKRAANSYETFLNTWENADPGIKEMDDARERLARLKS